jgi:hypothetical protein
MPDPSMPTDPPGSVPQRVAISARDGVVRALERVERGERNGLDRLRTALCAYVRALRDTGASKEEVIQAVRVLVSNPVNADARFGLLHPARVALVELSTHWCSEEYANKRAAAADEQLPRTGELPLPEPRTDLT